MTEDKCCIHAYISGRVQGVWFRAFTQKQAIEAKVSGWANNLPDGRVEVMLAGNKASLEQVMNALHQGPPLSQVDHIEQESLPYQAFTGFNIG